MGCVVNGESKVKGAFQDKGKGHTTIELPNMVKHDIKEEPMAASYEQGKGRGMGEELGQWG